MARTCEDRGGFQLRALAKLELNADMLAGLNAMFEDHPLYFTALIEEVFLSFLSPSLLSLCLSHTYTHKHTRTHTHTYSGERWRVQVDVAEAMDIHDSSP
jgi:hypothetical protein